MWAESLRYLLISNEFTSNFFFIQKFADNAETGIDERGIHLFTPKIYEQY